MRGKNSRRMRQRFSRKRKGQKSFLWANKHFSQPPFPPRIKIVTSKEEVAVLPADFLSEGYRRNFFNQIFHKNAIFLELCHPLNFLQLFCSIFFICATRLTFYVPLLWFYAEFFLFLSSLHKFKLPKAYAKKKLNTMKAFDHSISLEENVEKEEEDEGKFVITWRCRGWLRV